MCAHACVLLWDESGSRRGSEQLGASGAAVGCFQGEKQRDGEMNPSGFGLQRDNVALSGTCVTVMVFVVETVSACVFKNVESDDINTRVHGAARVVCLNIGSNDGWTT